MNENIQLSPVTPRDPKTSGMAITSFVLGLSSLLCWVFTGIPAIIFGIIARGKIKESRGQLTGDGLAIAGIVLGAVTTILIVPAMILVALLLPAVQAARAVAQRSVSANNMKQISIGLLNYESARKYYPPAGAASAPLVPNAPNAQLSWRVHLLPYLEDEGGAALYQQFRLDEPWDSEHNKTLINKMPSVYRDPSMELPPGETAYLAVLGAGTPFGDGKTPARLKRISDGTSWTIAFVEVDPDQAVIWTKPDDWHFNGSAPRSGLGKKQHGGFLAAFFDGSVRFVGDNIPNKAVSGSMTGEDGNAEDLRGYFIDAAN